MNAHTTQIKLIQKIALTFVFVFSFCFPLTTHAVTVGPVKLEYSADPGTVIAGDLYIKNEETTEKTLYPSVDQFTEQDGQKVFQEDQGLISYWLKTKESVTLKPGESTKVPYSIEIPKDAPPGGQFAVIWWGSVPPKKEKDTQDVSIQTRAGILVYLNVSGNIIEGAKIKSFDAQDGKTLFASTPVTFSMAIANEGNVYIKPKGSIKITSIFGNTVAELPLNPKGLQILPNSFRTFSEYKWDGSIVSIGPYKTEATLIYGAKQDQLVSSKWIWILPIKMISVIVVTLLILFILLITFFRMYNRWLLKQFKRSMKSDRE
jgi:hypothetical protein